MNAYYLTYGTRKILLAQRKINKAWFSAQIVSNRQQETGWATSLATRLNITRAKRDSAMLVLGARKQELQQNAGMQKALKLHKKALVILLAIGRNDITIAESYSNTGVVYYQLKQLDEVQ
jgi:hypothetical protein